MDSAENGFTRLPASTNPASSERVLLAITSDLAGPCARAIDTHRAPRNCDPARAHPKPRAPPAWRFRRPADAVPTPRFADSRIRRCRNRAAPSSTGPGRRRRRPVTGLLTAPSVAFDCVGKNYDGRTLVARDLDLRIARGEFLTLLGPSGSGKTTWLMMLAGFEAPPRGRCTICRRAGASAWCSRTTPSSRT